METGRRFTGEDWYGRDPGADAFLDCEVGSQLAGAKLRPVTVSGGNWSYVNLRGADLRGADLTGLDLREADLAAANLTDAVLARADLSRAVLRDAALDDADLVGADLSGVDLDGLAWRRTKVDPAQAVQIAEALGVVVTQPSRERVVGLVEAGAAGPRTGYAVRLGRPDHR